MKRPLLVFTILLLLVAGWGCTLFLVGLVPTMGKQWKKAGGEMSALQTNLLSVSDRFRRAGILVGVCAVLGAATYAYALWFVQRKIVFTILLLLVAGWACTLFLVGVVPTMGKEWKKAKGEMPALQTNLLSVSNWFEIDALLVSVFAVFGAATFAYALWLYSVGVAAGVVGLLFGWSFVPLVLGFPPTHRAQWTKAEGGPTLFQGFLLQASEWLQDGFHMIWTVFVVVFFTFVYVYALGMRLRSRTETALLDFGPSEVPRLGVDEDSLEPVVPEAPQAPAEPEAPVEVEAPVEPEVPTEVEAPVDPVEPEAPVELEAQIDRPEPMEVREAEDMTESDEPQELEEWDEPPKEMEGDAT